MAVKQDTFEGVDVINNNDAANYILGYNDTTILDASAGNAEAPAAFDNCRYISVDGDGIAKICYKDAWGAEVVEVKTLLGGRIYAIRNVIRLYQYYTGTTDGTVTVYKTDGSTLTNGIKLHR